MSKTFADFPLHESLQQALQSLGFTSPTPVQEQSIPAALEGKDLLVSSQTGSGKTAAFSTSNVKRTCSPRDFRSVQRTYESNYSTKYFGSLPNS